MSNAETLETLKDQKDPKEAPIDPEHDQKDPEEPETYSAEYVHELREEAKEQRERAKRADWLETEVRRLSVREAVRGVLTDPESLPWSDEFNGDDGLPDPDKIKSAAQALAGSKPWLSRPRGNVGQGEHSVTAQPDSLSALLQRL